MQIGQFDAAIRTFERMLLLGNRADDQWVIVVATNRLGVIFRKQGDLERAEKMHLEALDISENILHLMGAAIAYENLRIIYETRGDLEEAEKMLRLTMSMAAEMSRLELQANNYIDRGTLLNKSGDRSGACENWSTALEVFERIGMPRIEVEPTLRLMRDAGCGEKKYPSD
jgi:tetratricopeptide (TPR) repeat protein